MRRIEAIAGKAPGVKHTVAIAGQSILLNANAPNFGAMYVMLDDFHERTAGHLTGDAIAATLKAAFDTEIPDGRGQRLRGAAGRRAWARPAGFKIVIEDRGDNGLQALQGRRRQDRRRRGNQRRAAWPVHQLPGRHALAVSRHRPHRGQDDGRLDGRRVQHAASLSRLAVRQRLQPLRPHLAGQRAGRREIPHADRRPQAAQGPQRPGQMVPLAAILPASAKSAAR